jgi:hypothetical protein
LACEVGNPGKPTLVALCVGTTSAPSAALWIAWKGKAAAEERGMADGKERIQKGARGVMCIFFYGSKIKNLVPKIPGQFVSAVGLI